VIKHCHVYKYRVFFADSRTVEKIKMAVDSAREKALNDYRKRLVEHKENEARLKESK